MISSLSAIISSYLWFAGTIISSMKIVIQGMEGVEYYKYYPGIGVWLILIAGITYIGLTIMKHILQLEDHKNIVKTQL
ncbi:MAG: hypothetical protein NDF55_00220 [archaeon GB-1867-005]|nr:hypothetical protein [Candidatus Culexmicrobium cathedralense]